MKAILAAIFQWLANLFSKKPVINPVPSLPTDPITAGLDVAAEAAALGVTVEAYLLSPQYQAALLAKQKKQDMDQIRETEQKAEQGDGNALNDMRKNVS